MEKLLASEPQKLVTLHRGQQVEGEVVGFTDKEIILDLGAKSEGVLPKRDLQEAELKNLKAGDKLKAYVYLQENEHGQVALSVSPQVRLERTTSFKGHGINWSRFTQAQNQKSKLQGKVLEVNKGGLIVEVAGVRGFLPNSQVGFELMNKAGQGMEGLAGQDLTVTVIEVDQDDNKLIFSQRGQISDIVKAKLQSFKAGQTVTGKIVAILPFGLVVSIKSQPADELGVEGLVFISDVSWDRVEDLSKIFTAGQELEVKVLGLDEDLGRLNLSIKQLTEDPFANLAEKFPVDEVVKGEITGISEAGVSVKLTEELEGFLPGSKVTADSKYEVGKVATFLVDGVDLHRRKINLVPFVISTAGLIYK